MIFVWFIYGLAFFALGLAILVYPKRGSKFRLARHIWMIGVFGVIHGTHEWLDMFYAIGKPFSPEFLDVARMFTLPASFLFLLQFGVTIASRDTGRQRLVRLLPFALVAGWIAVVLTSGPEQRFLMCDIWARYLLCAPGAFLTAWGLLALTAEFKSMRLTSVARSLVVAAAAFLVYSVVAGVFTREADFLPASVLNYPAFMAAVGVPIQVFRALCAIVAAGSIVRILDVFRWETHENLRISELRCATIASAMPVFLFMTDRSMAITFIQGKGLEALGLSPEQARGRLIVDVFPSSEDFVENCRKALSGQDSEAVVSIGGVPFEVYCSAITDPSGTVSHMVGVALDISGQVKAREELDEYRRQMEKRARDAEVGVLSATMGRQIAEPLSVAQLTLDKLLGDIGEPGTSPDVVRHAVNRGLSEIAKAGTILDRFLKIAHPSLDSAVQPVGIYQIAKRTASVFAESAQRRGLTIAIKEMDLVPVMTLSPREMEQIFYQLIQWAVDAPDHGSGRTLVITCMGSDQHIELVFSDTGGADRMRRSGGSGPFDLNGIEGTGLGLAVVKQIVADHHGEIRTEVQPGGGGILRIRLPVTRVY